MRIPPLRTLFALSGFLILPVQAQVSPESEFCLTCHGEEGVRDSRFRFRNGAGVSLFVSRGDFESSPHGILDCSTCHPEFSMEDHPDRKFDNHFAYSQSLTESCQMCHSFEGLHARLVEGEHRVTCVNCHQPHAAQSAAAGRDGCQNCHEQELEMRLGDGSTLSLQILQDSLDQSVHKKLRCVDCHFGFSSKEHPQRIFQNRRGVTLALAESCRRCHFDKYTRTLESVHYQVLSKKNLEAPVCSDCHGSHTVQSGHHDKLTAARKCQNCHREIYETYAGSVHGEALLAAENQDVPVCSDCHTAHKIEDPRLTDFRNEIPQMCGDCHADETIMKRYGLSTAVLNSYLDDFHGVTLSYYQKEAAAPRRIAVCTDCHGIHNIDSLRHGDAEAVKAVLLERCRSCHPEASENFPDAWVSHYEPSLATAPLVYLINQFYRFFIPFMLIGLVLQILLHLWRYAIHR